jgi:uncharacterized RDD family membrane protein YckC
MRRQFETPEGVALAVEIASADQRVAAVLIDWAVMLLLLTALTTVALLAFGGAGGGTAAVIWVLGAFLLRNGYFMIFEMGPRAATPGKRLVGLRVVARDGGQLTGDAIVARNAMRELEVFLPLSFLLDRSAEGGAGWAMTLLGLGWSGIFLFMPLLNRDRLRVGDLIAGTWVVRAGHNALGLDLAVAEAAPGRGFSDAQLGVYGVSELQTLEQVLRQGDEAAIATVAGTIRRKLNLREDGTDEAFLRSYYAALRERLERQLLLGRRKADKYDRAA